MEQHFVTFLSPATFVAEATTKPIDSWDVEKAQEMAHEITERYSATPYGFRFSTRSRTDVDLDSKETATSGTYFLGGKIETLDEVKARRRPDGKDDILISNMEGNGYARIVTNDNSWRWTQPLADGDVVLDWKPRPKPKRKSA
jgi:hypothetical protein